MSDPVCWAQITAGVGPAECQWVVARLLDALHADASRHAVTLTLLETTDGDEPRTLRSALLAAEGDAAERWVRAWEGTIQWIGASPFRPNHKRKNWFVGVSALIPPHIEALDMSQVRVETFASGGPGGQHANTSDTAVRVTHTPTGLSVTARSERSQRLNRALALAELATRHAALGHAATADARQELWSQHHALERGRARHVFRGPRFRQDG